MAYHGIMPYFQKHSKRGASVFWGESVDIKAQARWLASKAHPEQQQCCVPGCSSIGHRHHYDYEKPTRIVWLCRKHHKMLHWALHLGTPMNAFNETIFDADEEWVKHVNDIRNYEWDILDLIRR